MTPNILIVDDSATTRAVIKRTLKMAGLCDGRIYEAVDGQAALDVLRACSVDLVLTDLNMPRLDGVQLIRRMDADPELAGIPVVVISAVPNATTLTPIRPAGTCVHVRKPFTPEQIKSVITDVLGVPHA